MRVLLISDGGAPTRELEADALPTALAEADGVSVDVVRFDKPGAPDDGTEAADVPELPEADVWVTDSTAALRRVGRLARRRGARLVHRGHDVLGVPDEGVAGLPGLLGLLGLADAVVVPTEAASAWLRVSLGTACPEVVVAPPWLVPAERPTSTLGQQLVVGAGPLVPHRRPAQVVRAFARAADLLPGWRLRFVGGGPQRRPVTGHAEQGGIKDRVGFSGPEVDLPAEWAGASVVVLAPRFEAYPHDALGAMAAGVPVVAFDVPGGTRELVRHDVNGLLVPPGSLTGLESALAGLAAEPDLLRRLGEGARRTAVEVDARHRADGVDRWLDVLAGREGRPQTGIVPPPAAAPTALALPTTPAAARTDGLRLLSDAAQRAGARWFVLPGAPPTVVVSERARDAVLAAMAAQPTDGLSVLAPAQAGWPEHRMPVRDLADGVRGLPTTLVVEPWPWDADGAATLVGQGCGVRLELWAEERDELRPPVPNGLLDVAGPGLRTVTETIEDVEVPVPAMLAGRLVGTPAFDVDVVYTWVDGSDPAWLARRDERLAGDGAAAADRTASGRARFENRDELRYSMRSVHLFAPWVRTIHVVTDGQVPAWLDVDHPRVRVVDHREILPPEALPTYNSHAIETALHRVPDLAEHFVYLNDDVLLGRPLTPSVFFSAGGSTAAFVSRQPIGDPPADAPVYLRAAVNNRRLLREALGITITSTLAHTPHPHRVSVLAEVERRFGEAVGRTASTPFRSGTDVSMLSSLAQHYGLLTGTAHPAEASLTFLGLAAADLPRQLAAARSRDQDFLCLGDHHHYALARQRVDSLVAEFLADYVPVAAPWER